MSISYKLIHFICLSLLVYMIVSVCTCHWRMTAFCIQHVFKNQTIEQWVSETIQEWYCIAVMDMVLSVRTKYNHVMQCVRQSSVSRLQNIVCHKQKTCMSQKLRLVVKDTSSGVCIFTDIRL